MKLLAALGKYRNKIHAKEKDVLLFTVSTDTLTQKDIQLPAAPPNRTEQEEELRNQTLSAKKSKRDELLISLILRVPLQ